MIRPAHIEVTPLNRGLDTGFGRRWQDAGEYAEASGWFDDRRRPPDPSRRGTPPSAELPARSGAAAFRLDFFALLRLRQLRAWGTVWLRVGVRADPPVPFWGIRHVGRHANVHRSRVRRSDDCDDENDRDDGGENRRLSLPLFPAPSPGGEERARRAKPGG